MGHCPIPKCQTSGSLRIEGPDGYDHHVCTGCPGLFLSLCPCSKLRPASGLGSGGVVSLSKKILCCCRIGS